MSHLYAGNETNPTSITLPDDGDVPDAASVNVGFEGLADRTKWLRRKIFSGAVNILSKVAAGAGQNFGACFVPGYDELWVVGEWSTNAQVYISNYFGASYVRQTSIDASIVTNPSHFYGVAANALGDIIVVGSVAHFYARTRSTGAWSADGWTTPGSFTRIVYVPTVDRFVAVGVTGANLTARVSPAADIHNLNNPTTQIGAGGTWDNFTAGLAVDVSTGKVAAVGISSSQPRVAYSTDGGVNFTTLAGLATTIVSPAWVDICHNPGDAWYLTVGESTGTHTGEIWRSTDAITWTKVATFANNFIRCIAGFTELLVGATASGSIVSSVDGGVTWRRCGSIANGTPLLKVENALGRAVFLTTTLTHVSADLGSSIGAALT